MKKILEGLLAVCGFFLLVILLASCGGSGSFSSINIDKQTLKKAVEKALGESVHAKVKWSRTDKITYKKFSKKERINPATNIKEDVVPVEISSIGFAQLGEFISINHHMDLKFIAHCYEKDNKEVDCDIIGKPTIIRNDIISKFPKAAGETVFEEL